MKKSPCPRSSGKSGLLRSALFLLAGGLLLASRPAAASDEDPYRINVVSSVDRVYTMFGKKPAAPHGKLYAIAGVKMSNDHEGPPVVPVDEEALLQQLRATLAARGFHEVAPGKAPDIVITLHYGRSKMNNPYTEGIVPVMSQSLTTTGGGPGAEGGSMSTSVPVVTATAEQLGKERTTPGYEEKLQSADNEKLFISVTAFEFPGFGPNPKKKMLWRTTATVDDPDRDLNPISGRMLGAAGVYFDHETELKEVTVLSTDKAIDGDGSLVIQLTHPHP
jgi:hypothetical protein